MALIGSTLGFGVLVSAVEKQGDRYLLPALLTLTVLGGIGLARILQTGKAGIIVGSGALILFAMFTVSLQPYALSYLSPLAWQEDPTQTGWGEGLEAAAEYLNRHPLARELRVATRYPVVFQEFFHGVTMSLSSRNDHRVDYVILYRSMRGRSKDSSATEILAEYATRVPVRTIRVLGKDLAWIYRTDSVDLFPEHVGELLGVQSVAGERSETGGASAIEVGQTITPTRDGLSGVRLLFSTFSSRANTPEVTIHLREDPDGSDVRTVQLDARTLQDRAWRDITFPPISDSKGKQYYLAVTSPRGYPGNAITANYQPRDILRGTLVLLRRPLRAGERKTDFVRDGDLAYTLEYSDGTRDDAVTALSDT